MTKLSHSIAGLRIAAVTWRYGGVSRATRVAFVHITSESCGSRFDSGEAG